MRVYIPEPDVYTSAEVWERIGAMAAEALKEAGSKDSYCPDKSLLNFLYDKRILKAYLLEKGEEVVGYAIVIYQKHAFTQRPVGDVVSLYIKPEYRTFKAKRRLMKAIKKSSRPIAKVLTLHKPTMFKKGLATDITYTIGL